MQACRPPTGAPLPPHLRSRSQPVSSALTRGDEHDACYTPGSLYATVTLSIARLEQVAAIVPPSAARAFTAIR